MKSQKVTQEILPARRRYDDACAAAHAMDLFGERWALPVMRELMLGPRRFTDLKRSLAGISANVLTQRLEGLEAAGVLVRRRLPPPAATHVYELTAWGYEAGPIFQAMGRWAAKSPSHDPTRPFSAVSLLLSFRTMFDPALAGAAPLRIGFRVGEELFFWAWDGAQVTIGRGDAEAVDALFVADPAAVAAAAYGGAPLAGGEAAGTLAVVGDRAAAERFLELFALPARS